MSKDKITAAMVGKKYRAGIQAFTRQFGGIPRCGSISSRRRTLLPPLCPGGLEARRAG